MEIIVDVAYKNLNKYTEILCEGRMELLQTEDSNIVTLAGGMGSGVKANILFTLASKILGTMPPNDTTLEECMDTISETLLICQARQVAYSTFSILQIYHNDDAYLVEYDNPGCMFIRGGRFMGTPKNVRAVQGRGISEYRLKVKEDDALILMNDGTTHAGVGGLLNFGWLWQDIADYTMRQYSLMASAMRLATSVSEVCDEPYQFWPRDGTTVAYMHTIDSKLVHLTTGSARDPEDDVRMAQDLMDDTNAKTTVCGGTSAIIVSRVLGKKLGVSPDYVDPEMPPIVYMGGVNLVTEGVLVLNRVPQLLCRHVKNETVPEESFQGLDKPNGGSMVVKVLIEDCTEAHLYVGKTVNSAYQSPGLPLDLGIRQNLVEQLKHVVEEMGKTMVVTHC